ncbi:putative bifunctional diguanylate cyclase/phosphodiesterase [Eggerthella guodeyinii]|uniref:EAL domain-containing protein n=1 Tax=Eggerthella guodeyinii TaxID=2690837 RepID=A0A6N7RL20_9ACTN|nr:GGDEF domain-containing phosphodiesterase [Eggerthella guodeyinii]MRX81621.1 EAL domain-containing protein [Eggerthella guodeyinii]
MKRKVSTKGLIVVALWVFGAIVLIAFLMQVRSYAGVINDSGVVRGGTQRVVKMELEDERAEKTEARVSALLADLKREEDARPFKGSETSDYMLSIEAVERQWGLILDEINRLEQGTGSKETLLALSETHFELADTMVMAAQTRAEHEFLLMGIICAVLFLLAATIMLFMRNDRIAKLRAAYFIDSLTNRKNLLAFEEQAAEVVSGAEDGAFLVVYTNVSNFRYVNESYGYDVGNRLIVTLARLLDGACGRNELAAHANADHFVLLLRAEPNRVERLCEVVEEKLRESPDLHFANMLSFGCGVCAMTKATGTIPTAVSNAIAVLKGTGEPGKVTYYDDAFRAGVEQKNRIEQRMDYALAQHEFLLYLQPKNDLADGSLVGAEALCRWESEDMGFLSPDQFIPVFEKNGFIVQLDFFMLTRVCQCYPLMPPDGDEALVVSVNFSRVTVLREGFEERLVRIVDGAHVPRECIEIEVTESAFVVNEDAVIDKLISLKRCGFRLAMDDFGTGYSSLNLLRKLPIDVLKVDRGFLNEDAEMGRTRAVLKGVVDMANDLGLTTVCEGVETWEQVAMLRELGCDVGQGYVYSRPLPLDQFREKFATGEGRLIPMPKPEERTRSSLESLSLPAAFRRA